MPKIDKLFEMMMDRGGSDLHLEEGQVPKIRLNGILVDLDEPVLTEKSLLDYLEEICGPNQWQRYHQMADVDFAYDMAGKARFRSNYFRHAAGYGAIFRIIPSEILTLEKLQAPEIFKSFATLRAGLVLVTGPTGSGKSTTMAAIIDYINENFARKIVTIEEPVEFVHPKKQCLLTHREVGEDTRSFASGLKGAIRSDSDVVLVGEMRDRETIELALTATEMGILVFGTLHTNSASKTIDRIVDVFPHSQKEQVRGQLSHALKGIISQQLLRSADGKRRWAAHEILLYTAPLPALVRSGDSTKLFSYIQTGKRAGMITMDDCLLEMIKEGKITKEAAYMKAIDKKRFA